MKKISVLSLLLTASVLLNACASQKNNEKENSAAYPEKISVAQATQISDEELISHINSFDNFIAAEDFYSSLNSIESDAVYEYLSFIPNTSEADMQECYDQFIEMFEYIFPDREMKDDYFLYIGGSSTLEYGDFDEEGYVDIIKNFNKVSDYYDQIVSGEEGNVGFTYDETWFRTPEMAQWNDYICLSLPSPYGYGAAEINKGKAAYLSGKVTSDIVDVKGIEVYPILESYDPITYFECVGTYSPDSTESYKLTDKETPINEAVVFYEEYIRQLPCPGDPTVDTCVVEVKVLKLDEQTYGYYYKTAGRYNGVPFDTINEGSMSEFKYDFSGGYGFMLESNDVDVICSFRRLQEMDNVIEYKEIVSLQKAIEIMNQNLTAEVDFEVQKAELVYNEQYITVGGRINMETYERNVVPSWKVTMHNSNDNKTYVCYVDAKDGGNFDYYTMNILDE